MTASTAPYPIPTSCTAALRILVLSLFAAFLLGAAVPSHAGVAQDAVKAVTGAGNQTSQSVEYPYADKETPDSLEGWVDYVLDFPLYKTGGEWIRLHQLFWALLILISGVWLSVMLGRLLNKWMIRFKRMPKHIAIAVSKGLTYLLAFFALIGAVLFVGMPFTIVSIFGAVVLLGASLGAKSTIYDYLSGLVIAIEQPFRIGDCIEVSEHTGFVEEISGRYTRVRRFDGIDVLVPNSKFLEEEIINWTLLDTRLRGEVAVGVEYGSDIDATMEVLYTCMQERDDILDAPEPSVLLWEFAESALLFKLFFWLKAENPLEMWTVSGKLRIAIYKKLHEAGISIAYPQRDVHLHAADPIQVSGRYDNRQDQPGAETEEEERQGPETPKERPPSKPSGKGDMEHVAKPESDNPEEPDDSGEPGDAKSNAPPPQDQDKD